jgi:ligand-binding sensor domain-containing protein
VQLFDEGRGLPDARALSVASRRGNITIGTAHGIARITDSLHVVRLAQGFADAALAVAPAAGDTIWIGTTAGVYAALPGAETAVRPRAIGASASLQVPVVALRFMGDTLVGLTQDQLMWRDPKSGAWTLGPTLSNVLGRLRAFTLDRTGFWVGGERGIGFVRLNTPPLRPLINGELPALVRDLAVDAEHLWVATDAGLVRWSLDAIRP